MLTMAITAETPMTMPSMVRAERILLRASARKAIRKITSMFMRSNLQFFISPIGLIGPNTAIPGMKNYGHLSRRPGRKIGAEKGKKAVCFIFLPTSFCQALFASSQAGSNRELLVLIVLSIVIILIIQRGQCLEFFGGVASMKHRLVASDLAVAEDDDALGVFRDVVFVSDDQQREAAFAVEPLENLHDLDRSAAVERARRLVGQDDRRLIDQRPRDRDALLLPTRKLIRMIVLAPGQPDRFERLLGAALSLRSLDPGVEHWQLHVLDRRRAREQV